MVSEQEMIPWPNHPAPGNAAFTLGLSIDRQWLGVPERC